MVWIAGAPVTAAQLNQYAPQEFTSYTPAWTGTGGTQPVKGNGTFTGRYMQGAGKWVTVAWEFAMGSTSTYGDGFFRFSLPVAARITSNALFLGDLMALDTSASAAYKLHVRAQSSTTVDLVYHSITTAGLLQNSASPANPFTWATGDTIKGYFGYEGA